MGDARIAAVVLAAGEGKRLRSKLPKVLHLAAGRPLLAHALDAIAGLDLCRRVVVVSARREEISTALRSHGHAADLDYVIQDPPLGTGDAVRVALDVLGDADHVLVTLGDAPLMRPATLQMLIDEHLAAGAGATALTAVAPGDTDGGRIIRDDDGAFVKIVEAKDASPEQLLVREVNSGFCVFDTALLRELIARLRPANAQGEFYLTDVFQMARDDGARVMALTADWTEAQGVNDRVHLAETALILRRRIAEGWMREGVTIIDPSTTFIDASVTLERDSTVLPFTFLEGSTSIAEGATVGPQTRIVDSSIGSEAVVSYSVVRGSSVGAGASVGPFASLRPGTRLEEGAKLGTFVETKNTTVGKDSKAGHLTYLGDAEIGERVNIGAGTITCNWDGREKHRTVINDDAYISSDTMLVAPVTVGEGAATGAGSVVRDDVPAGALAVGVPAKVLKGKGRRMKKSEASGSDEPHGSAS